MNSHAGKRQPQIEILDEAMVEVLRRKTPAEAWRWFCSQSHHAFAAGGASAFSHPDWDDQTVMREIARRMLGGTG